MTPIALDVETLGQWTPEQEAAVREMAEKRSMDPAAYAALCPPLARVVCVGVQPVGGVARVFYDASLFPNSAIPEGAEGFEGERPLLERVNAGLARCSRIVTFNGRCFDLPVLIHRTIANGLAPSSKLVKAAREYRFRPSLHIDLRDQFGFFGASSNGTLRAFALGYGLEDPKAEGDGGDVAKLIEAGDVARLVRYQFGDVDVTAELYDRWIQAVGEVA